MREPDGHLVKLSEAQEDDLVVEQIEPKHTRVPNTFVLTANDIRYRNTKSQRKKARKAQQQSRKKNR